MHVAALTVEIALPGCRSLKQKRSRVKPLLTQLHRHFNVSAAEIDRHDLHAETVIACVVVSNDGRHVQRLLEGIPAWIETRWPDLTIIDHHLTVY